MLAVKDPKLYRLKKFQRAIRRLVLLTRAAKKQGKKDYNIGALVYELSENNNYEKQTTDWIEIVISQLNMKDLISDDVLTELNEKIEEIKQRTRDQSSVFNLLQEEVQQIDFDMVFKDTRLLKKVRNIMTGKSKMLKEKEKKQSPSKQTSQRGDPDKSQGSDDSISDISISAMYLKK